MAYTPATNQLVSKDNAAFLKSGGSITWWGNGPGPGGLLALGRIFTWDDWTFYVGNAGRASRSDYTRAPRWGDASVWHVAAVSPSYRPGSTYFVNNDGHALIQWDLNVKDVATWRLTGAYGIRPNWDVSGTTDNYTVNGLAEDTTYGFELYGFKNRTRDGQNEELRTATISQSVTMGLLHCTLTSASYNSSTGVVSFTFTNNSTAATEFEIKRNGTVIFNGTVGTMGTTGARTYDDTVGTSGGETYEYVVSAVKKVSGSETNRSMASSPASVTTPTTSPSQLIATYQGTGTYVCNLSWPDSIDEALWQYRVEYALSNGSGSAITGWTLLGTTTNTSMSHTGLTSGQYYIWQIRAERQDLSQTLTWTQSADVYVD